MKRRSHTFVVLNGGLGNQLFQCAAAASISGLHNVRVVSSRSTPHLELATLMPGFATSWSQADRWRLGRPFDFASGWRRVVEIALRPLRWAVARRTVRGHLDLAEAFAPRPARPSRPLVLDGYFQHPDWYERARPALVDVLVAAAPPARQEADTVLHVRGGDYRGLGWQLDVGYYERSLALLGAPSTVRIITDDHAAGEEVAAVCTRRGWVCAVESPGASAVDDFWTLAAARRLVMSNSTFCWWAAQVGDARWGVGCADRVVVFPEQWVLGHGSHLRQDSWVGVQ